jgi:hypothetical protein
MRNIRLLVQGDERNEKAVKTTVSDLLKEKRVNVVDFDAPWDLIIFASTAALNDRGQRGVAMAAFLRRCVTAAEVTDRFRQIQGNAIEESALELINIFGNNVVPQRLIAEAGDECEELCKRVVTSALEIIGTCTLDDVGRPVDFTSTIKTTEGEEQAMQTMLDPSTHDRTLTISGRMMRVRHAEGATSEEASRKLQELREEEIPIETVALDPNASPVAVDLLLKRNLDLIHYFIGGINGILHEASDRQLPPYYRESARATLFQLYEATNVLQQSVHDRAPAQSDIVGHTLRLIRLGQIDRGYKVEVKLPSSSA